MNLDCFLNQFGNFKCKNDITPKPLRTFPVFLWVLFSTNLSIKPWDVKRRLSDNTALLCSSSGNIYGHASVVFNGARKCLL